MKLWLKRLHILVGISALVLFPLTGAYMRRYLADDFAASERMRFSMRANHIYILFLALPHLLLAAYLRFSDQRWRQRAPILGSLLLLSATILVVGAFALESKQGLERPITLLAAVFAIAGTLIHIFAVWHEQS